MSLKELLSVLSDGIYSVISTDGIAYLGDVIELGHDVISRYRYDVRLCEVVNAKVVLFDVENKEIFINYRVGKED